jgi:DNA-binding transcriptional ArsR family regulator
MANYPATLDRTFAALTDPTRRAMLARLEQEGALTVGALAQTLPIRLPAVLKHLGVLQEAGLVTRAKAGRTVTIRLSPGPLREARDWLARYERFWGEGLERLAAMVEAEGEPPPS